MTEQLVIDGQRPSAMLSESVVGGKGSRLAALRDAGHPVPAFYCLTTAAFGQAVAARDSAEFAEHVARLCTAESDARSAELAAVVRRWIADLPFPPEVEQSIRGAQVALFGNDLAVAVRSSAAGEDGRSHSFAGMHDTILNVRGIEAVLTAIRCVWESAWSDRAIAYRRQRKLSLAGITPAVVVQQMVKARSAGVLFTCDPATGHTNTIVISAVLGSGESLVSGECAGEMYVVDKQTGHSPSTEKDAPLSAEQLRLLTGTAVSVEQQFGRPQDIEFCFDAAGRLFVLQARDVVDPAEYGPAAGNHLVWDNSNIIESYSGVTTPMTFSFIRRAYAIVYYCFSEVMGISPRVTRANRGAFENMLGLFRGRVYYNLKNWYRLVQLFPGYQYNRRFMETMMGLPDSLAVDGAPATTGRLKRWFVELPALVRLLTRSAWNFMRIETIVARFQDHFNRHYDEWSRIDFRKLKPHQLHELHGRMEDTMLWNWKAPIITDFYVMVFYGILKKLCATWCGDVSGTLQNGLVCGEERLESAEPAKMLLGLAAMARENAVLRDLIVTVPEQDLPRLVATDARFVGFAAEVAHYLDRYGLRCVHELKLEAESFRDHPHLLYRLLRNFLTTADPATFDLESLAARQRRVRSEAEAQAWSALARSRSWLPRRLIFSRVLRNARRGIRHRENMRFARTRIYGILRDMLRAIGEQLAAEGILDNAGDIFYLTIDEVWDFVKGTAVTTDLRGLARLRKEEFDGYRLEPTPPPERRFDTYGLAYHRNLFRRQQQPARPDWMDGTESQLAGIGCCPGVVEGPVAIVSDLICARQPTGTILVAERTDPGWVPIFPGYSGILIERGSLLSHSAIVAREMGIPTIVGITGLTARLRSGQIVRMDGRAGTVEIVNDRVQTISSTSKLQ